MGQHKFNPTAIAAKNDKLPPRNKDMSKRETDAWLRKKIQDVTGLSALMNAIGKPYLYI